VTNESGPQPVPGSSLGSVLQARRVERGLTLAQAAATTRVRIGHLEAIEAGDMERLPAPVFARGYVRTYARYLGVDPEPMVGTMPAAAGHLHRSFGVAGPPASPRVVLSAPVAAVVTAAIVLSAFGLYAWRQLESVNPSGGPSNQPAAQLAVTSPPTTTSPSPSPQRTPIVVGVRVTDTVWINVIVDGQPQYADSGRILQPGTSVSFTGLDIKITSGRAAATFITIDDRAIGTLGDGVVTREFKAT
jgi:cytoskeletal protein RodZ